MKYLKYIVLSLLILSFHFVRAQDLTFSLPSGQQLVVGNTLDAALMVNEELTDYGIYSYTFVITFNANLVRVVDVVIDDKLDDFHNVVNREQPGRIVLTGASETALNGSGELFNIRFEGISRGNTALSFSANESVLNEGAPVAFYQNGSIAVLDRPAITVTPNEALLSVGQQLQFQVGGNRTAPYTWGVTNSEVASIDDNGLLTALKHGETAVFVEDAALLRDTTDRFITITAAHLNFPTTFQEWQGWDIALPLHLSDVSMLGIISGELTLDYRSDVLQFLGMETENTLLADATFTATEISPGKMNFVFASATPLTSETDELIRLCFHVLPTANRSTALTFSQVVFNESVPVVFENGSFTPKILPLLTITPNVTSMVAGDSLLFDAENGIPPYVWSVSDERVAVIDEQGLLRANEGGVVDVIVIDSVGATTKISNIGVADMRIYFPADTLVNHQESMLVACLSDSIPIEREAVSSLEGEISLSSNKLKITGIETAGTFTEGWQITIVPVSDQRIKFWLAGSTPFRDRGVAFYLAIEPDERFAEYDRCEVQFHNAEANEGVPVPKFLNGVVEGKLFTDQDHTICLEDPTELILAKEVDGRTINYWQKRLRLPGKSGSTPWIRVNHTGDTFQDTPSEIGEWEYRVVLDGAPEKMANVKVNTIPDVYGTILGEIEFCNVPQTQRYVVKRAPTATEYLWQYTGEGVILHPSENVLDLEITHDVTPGSLILHTANACGVSADSLLLELNPIIQPASFDFEDLVYFNRDTVLFKDTSVGVLSRSWSLIPETGWQFVEGFDSSSPEPEIQFHEAGMYRVKLETVNSCRVDSAVRNVVIQQFDVGNIVPDHVAVCQSSEVAFTHENFDGVIENWQMKSDGDEGWIDLLDITSDELVYTSPEAGDFLFRVKLAHDRGYSDEATLTVYPQYKDTVAFAVCENETPYLFGTKQLFESGRFTELFTTQQGCDSLVTVDFTVLPVPVFTDVQYACGTFTWINGITYTESNSQDEYVIPFGAKNGCDSIVRLDLTVVHIDSDVTEKDAVLTAVEMDAVYQRFACGDEMVLLTGETGRSYAPSENGDYAVEITKEGCSVLSACIPVTTVHVKRLFENQVQLYPNPVKEKVHINLRNHYDFIRAQIVTVEGQVVQLFEFENRDQITLDISTQSPGLLFIRLSADEEEAVLKIVKMR